MYVPWLKLAARKIEFCGKENHVSFLIKYNPESNSWEDISSFDHLDRYHVCIVASDDYVYFIGGVKYEHGVERTITTEVDRYDPRKDQWRKVADIHEGCMYHWGAAVNETIFIAGYLESDVLLYQCQVYNETTNEWQIIASPSGTELLAVDGKLFAVGYPITYPPQLFIVIVECYDPIKDKWTLKNKTAPRTVTGFTNSCPMRIYKEFLAGHQLESFNPRPSMTRSFIRYFQGSPSCTSLTCTVV